jgi:hypothetical protein
MPRKMVKAKRSRRNSLTDKRLHFLRTGELSDKFTTLFAIKKPTLADLWRRHGAEIVRDHIKQFPCTRPPGWWLNDAPDDYRRLVAGRAGGENGPTRPNTPYWLRYPSFVWIDENCPAQVESETAFLARHELLTADELKFLYSHPQLIKPVILMTFDPGYPYDWKPCSCNGKRYAPVRPGARIETCPKCGRLFYEEK